MSYIKITMPSGKVKTYSSGILVSDIFKDEEFNNLKFPIVAAMINNDTASLSYRVEVNSSVEPLTVEHREGMNIYRRSLCFLLTIAAKEVLPDKRLVIGHSLGRSYFYYFEGIEGIPEEYIIKIREKMNELVKRNMPVTREVISYLEALDYFQNNNQPDTALLLANRNDPKIPVYRCGNFIDIAHAPLVPNTGILDVYEIRNYPPGFLLRYPSFGQPKTMLPFQKNPVLFSIYREYKNWGKILNVNCVGLLNELNRKGEMKQFIQVAEALQNKKIAQIADKITEKRDDIKIVLIAGPSSSGKTTFSKKLAIQLKVCGRNPATISLDNYFLSRDKTPKDKNGEYDFEALEALDIELLNKHLVMLMHGKEILIPNFDFHKGERKPAGKPFRLPKRGILIMEGIHGLNDNLTPLIERGRKYKIYVSALTQLNLDDHNRISTTDNRLIRRIVRDARYRGHTAITTLKMWPSVRKGEYRNIFPFQNSSDSAFNSALDYELAVLKVYAEPLLRTVKPDEKEYFEARRLLSFLNNFAPLPPNWVPPQSILREFIGGSAFKY
ncbi:MAG: nucleoside kinase [Spirochaetales bacterium]|nr:nucleoside kinase [Spirochaetales bacterium]